MSALCPAACGIALAGALLLVGCGQKGPLYLPDHNATVVTRTAPAGASQARSSSASASSSRSETSATPEPHQ